MALLGNGEPKFSVFARLVPVSESSYGSRQIDYETSVKLPEDLLCNHCVLQWRYHTGNSWGCTKGNETDCEVGKGTVFAVRLSFHIVYILHAKHFRRSKNNIYFGTCWTIYATFQIICSFFFLQSEIKGSATTVMNMLISQPK